jgi:phosphopantetheinyl transferase (holo-ACP synthase)
MQELAIRKFFTLPLPKHHEMLAKSYAIKERVIKASNEPTTVGLCAQGILVRNKILNL